LLVELNGTGSFTVHSFPPERKRIDIGDYYSDPSLYERTVGWTSHVSLREGLTKTLDFYRHNLSRYL
jgi:UDP-glucose 4-epimerase